jgi:DNA-binding MarR family transcriptional regulator
MKQPLSGASWIDVPSTRRSSVGDGDDRGPTEDAAGVDVTSPPRSATGTQLAHSVSKFNDLGGDGTERILAAGMILRVRELLLRELDAVLNRLGTSHARYQVLSIVCLQPDGLQIGQIAARASIHPTTMTATIDRLERGGLIVRRADPNDRRATLAVATPEGHKLYSQAHADLAAVEYGLDNVDSATIKRLVDGLDTLAVAFERRNSTTKETRRR